MTVPEEIRAAALVVAAQVMHTTETTRPEIELDFRELTSLYEHYIRTGTWEK